MKPDSQAKEMEKMQPGCKNPRVVSLEKAKGRKWFREKLLDFADTLVRQDPKNGRLINILGNTDNMFS